MENYSESKEAEKLTNNQMYISSESSIKPGKYKHYKGKYYLLIDVGRHSETLEEVAIYKALYDSSEFGEDAIWVRPLKMFTEMVIIDNRRVPRFQYCGE